MKGIEKFDAKAVGIFFGGGGRAGNAPRGQDYRTL